MRQKMIKSIATGIAAILLAWRVTPALAGTVVYKCVKDGKITLTDIPCPTDKAAGEHTTTTSAVTTVPSSRDLSAIGKWTGQIQFQETAAGRTVGAAHSVVLMSVEFTQDGKVTGSAPDNGCRVLGVWSQGPTPTLVWLDITISNCGYSDFDRRYNGSLILARPDSNGALQLNSIGFPLGPDAGKALDIRGTLRR